jgi:AcrR family transcriptional regulator
LISLYAVFGGRDELLRAVFDRYGPILVLDEAISGAQTDLYEAVHRIYRALPEAFSREPRVAPAMIACAAPPYHATAATSPVNLTRDRRRLGHHRRRLNERTPEDSSATLRGIPASPTLFESTTENPTPATC